MGTGPGLFFSGTDTGVGKTFVTAGVTRLLREQGHAISIAKPVATGARRVRDRWLCDDTTCLANAAGETDLDRITRWAFPEPVAPSVAAGLHGLTLTLPDLVEAVTMARRPGGTLLVEGVGGLLCPLTERETVADLVAALEMPLVIVTRRSLGTLNHTLLTLDVAAHRGLSMAGLVVSETTPATTLAEATNVEELRRRVSVPLLAVLPHSSAPGIPPGLEQVDWWRLCHSSIKPAPR